MKITISSSSNNNIDEKYKISAKKLLDYLVTLPNVELNWGSCSTSIMGLCYDTFKMSGLPINGYTTSKYAADLENLTYAKHKMFNTTYDLKKQLFYDGDIIIVLFGGSGTISEFFAYLEENRSNDANKLLIVWNEGHFFDLTLEVIKDFVNKKFNDESIYDYFKVANNLEEFKSILKENKVI